MDDGAKRNWRSAGLNSILVLAFAVFGLILQTRLTMDPEGWGIDFNQFYAAGRLAGTGHLYDWEALSRAEREHGRDDVPTARIPVVAYGYKALSIFPYRTSQILWFGINLAALIVFAAAWPGLRWEVLAVALTWSSGAGALIFGQDLPLMAMFFALGLRLLEKKRDAAAGVVFTLCACKFHLALGLPVMLIAQRRWRTIFAGGISTAALLAASTIIEGPAWFSQYLKMTAMPEFISVPGRMPSLFGFSSWLPWPAAFEIASACLVIVLLWRVCGATAEVGLAGAFAAAAGQTIARHTFMNDCVLVIPLAVYFFQRKQSPLWLKAWAGVMFTPVPLLLITSSKPWIGQLVIVGFVIAALVMQVFAIRAADPARKELVIGAGELS